MSLVFNQTASPYKGLVQLYERELGFTRGDVSGNANRLAEFTTDCNLALDDFWTIAIPASGTWQLDDSGHSDFPVIKTNIVASRRDYTFTTDQQSNLILDIYKVFILQSADATLYTEIEPIDELEGINDITAEGTTGATPYQYGKMANGIFLDPIPSYDKALGLKVYINREASYFTSGDTTKKPGVPGNLHKYFYLKPAYEYARRNNLAKADRLAIEVAKMEGAGGTIAKQFASRAKDERKKLTMAGISFR
jgi:hypothetical protein